MDPEGRSGNDSQSCAQADLGDAGRRGVRLAPVWSVKRCAVTKVRRDARITDLSLSFSLDKLAPLSHRAGSHRPCCRLPFPVFSKGTLKNDKIASESGSFRGDPSNPVLPKAERNIAQKFFFFHFLKISFCLRKKFSFWAACSSLDIPPALLWAIRTRRCFVCFPRYWVPPKKKTQTPLLFFSCHLIGLACFCLRATRAGLCARPICRIWLRGRCAVARQQKPAGRARTPEDLEALQILLPKITNTLSSNDLPIRNLNNLFQAAG